MAGVSLQIALPTGLALGVAVAAVVLVGLYRLRLRALPAGRRRWILLLRGLFLLIVVLLVLNPRVEWTRTVTVPPRIGIYLDNSLSMAHHPAQSSTTVMSQVSSVAEWAQEWDYEPVIYSFGERLTRRTRLEFDYQPDERLTDFSLLEKVWQTEDLQAAFLFSDGVATAGVDPGLLAESINVPTFTVGIGDTTQGLDLSIVDVRYPLSLLDQEQGRIQITIRGSRAGGRRSRLLVFHEDQVIHTSQVRFTSEEYLERFEAPVVGRLDATRFRVELTVLPEEANIDNNRREFRIDVLPGRRRITILTGTPSPNTPLIGRVLGETRHARIDHLTFLRAGWQGDEAEFWRSPQDLVVLDNYPPTSVSWEQVQRLLAKIRADGSAVLVLEGPNNHNLFFRRLMRNLGVPVATADDSLGSISPLYPAPAAILKGLPAMPAAGAGPSVFPSVRRAHIIERQSDRQLEPLLTGGEEDLAAGYGLVKGRRVGVLLLPELMSVHLRLNRTTGRDYFPRLLKALVEWALEPEGFFPYVVRPDRRNYHLGEKVLFRGIERDRAGVKILEPMLTLEVEGPASTSTVTLVYNFDTGEYEGEYWPGEAGRYRVRLFGEDTGVGPGSASGFQVQTGRVELESLAQNRYGLRRLARATGGRYLDLQEVQTVLSEISYAPRTVRQEDYFSLWRFRYLWVGLVLLLAIEWGFRRLAGLL